MVADICNGGYQFEDFNIKPAVPNATLIKDQTLLYYLEDKLKLQSTEVISVKDAARHVIAQAVEKHFEGSTFEAMVCKLTIND